MKVAVIGAGIAGMGAAWTLAKRGMTVSLYEQNSEIGGDAYTVPVHGWDGTLHKVDGGVSDFNRSNVRRTPAINFPESTRKQKALAGGQRTWLPPIIGDCLFSSCQMLMAFIHLFGWRVC
ncbi:MAG TPA: FAD/NAD(P)-binding protein, partial [Oligoflexus sp.]|uniref:NAD(P)-binding protein n=1 Tax=Oligoflexus sp. TaxID=1971216 RepID=UPI002D653E4F